MNNEHPISDEVLDLADMALSKGKHWMAYNQSLYFIDTGDVYFFDSQEEANDFAKDNISDRDSFCVIRINDIKDIFERIPYDNNINPELVRNPDINGLYNREGNIFTDALIDHFEQQQLSLFNSQIKTNVMNNENFQYLGDNLKYMGFGENLKADLEKNMNEGKNEFQLFYKAEINKKPFEATLNFRKSDSTDMYFFNNYHATLQKNNEEKVDRTFFTNKGKGVTSKEAFNLLDGRAVHKDLVTKEGVPYKAWTQLDFANKDKYNNFEVKQFHENYGFDLGQAVAKFPITELNDTEKENQLIQSLRKGNLQSVTIENNGQSQKMFIEADPQFKKVNLYDTSMKLVSKEAIGQYESANQNKSKATTEDLGNDKKKELKKEVKPGKVQATNKTKSLLPKKRENTKKGLGVS